MDRIKGAKVWAKRRLADGEKPDALLELLDKHMTAGRTIEEQRWWRASQSRRWLLRRAHKPNKLPN